MSARHDYQWPADQNDRYDQWVEMCNEIDELRARLAAVHDAVREIREAAP